jgi:hypothetical protein
MLARFERLMERAVEGSLRRVFPTSLQPIQLAKSAARAMEQAQIVGLRGVEVPNLYRVDVAGDDLRHFGGYTPRVCEEIRTYLLDYARERELRPVAELRVEIVEDAQLRPGVVRTRAEFANLTPETKREVERAAEGTRRLRLADLDAAKSAARPTRRERLRLTDLAGLEVELDPELEMVRLGRAPDNDVVLHGNAVSRYHAQLRWVKDNWLVYDLSSTNGTWLDEQRLAPTGPGILEAGAVLRLGDQRLEVQAIADRPRGRD